MLDSFRSWNMPANGMGQTRPIRDVQNRRPPMSVEADAIAISTWAYRARFVTDDCLPSPYFAASPPALNHGTVGQRSEALRIACRCRRTRQLSPLRADDNRTCRARSERLRATPVAVARCAADRYR